jgi:hypothetical protein
MRTKIFIAMMIEIVGALYIFQQGRLYKLGEPADSSDYWVSADNHKAQKLL